MDCNYPPMTTTQVVPLPKIIRPGLHTVQYKVVRELLIETASGAKP